MKKPKTSSHTKRAKVLPASAPPPARRRPEVDGTALDLSGPATVLLAVTGMSPAVLTETVWALAHEAEPVVPERVIVVTTAAGRAQIERQLFTPVPRFGDQCPWDALRAALQRAGLPVRGRLRFGTTPDDIRVITGVDAALGRSSELSDIRSPSDSEAAADFLLEQLRGLVENPDLRVVASLAGGRKTMGALLYACLTMAGRETDRLTHVLVSEPYETLREFYFPGQPGGALAGRDGMQHSPAHARIELADVTFVPLRNLFLRELGRPAGSFRRLVDLCRANVRRATGEHLRLEVDLARPESLINGRRLTLAPREHLVLVALARRAKQGDPILGAYDELLPDLEDLRKQLLASASPRDWTDWRHELTTALEARDLVRILSDIRAKTKRAGGDAALLAGVLPEKRRCSLDVPGELIYIKGSNSSPR